MPAAAFAGDLLEGATYQTTVRIGGGVPVADGEHAPIRRLADRALDQSRGQSGRGQSAGPARVSDDIWPRVSAPHPRVVPLAAAYDYYSVEECRALSSGWWLKNHFASCANGDLSVDNKRCTSAGCQVVGTTTARFTLLGSGVRGQQILAHTLLLDRWRDFGTPPLPATELRILFDCVNYINAACHVDSPGAARTLAGWKANPLYAVTMDTSGSVGGGDLVHYDVDRVNYHNTVFRVIAPDGSSSSFSDTFRCDAAAYASGGGCIFDRIDSNLHYELSPNSGVADVAQHILRAQTDAAHTTPGGTGIVIPGGRQSGQKLTRLYPGMDANSASYYNRNHTLAVDTCVHYFGINYTQGGTRECDEYPFRSTWEGAHFTEVSPGSAWKYSVSALDKTENQTAGNRLGTWYTDDHILSKDAFWVQIDP